MIERPKCPDWVNAVFESLYAEVDSGSGLKWLFDEEEQQLIFAPPVVELQGGVHDGAKIFDRFLLLSVDPACDYG